MAEQTKTDESVQKPGNPVSLTLVNGQIVVGTLTSIDGTVVKLTSATVRSGTRISTFDIAFVRNGQLIIFVIPGNLDGFTEQITGTPPTASISFVVGPGTPLGFGNGSVQLATGANGAGTAELRNNLYDLLPLSSLSTLSYSTYVSSSGGKAPYLLLDIDTSGTGATANDHLFFEPFYQATPLTLNTWQTWDAMGGVWYPTGGGFTTLSDYINDHSAARIINTAGVGGLHIVAGPVAGILTPGGWSNFVGNVNPLVVEDSNSCINYDFDPSAGFDNCR